MNTELESAHFGVIRTGRNVQEYLDSLPDDVKEIVIDDWNCDSLPNLDRFTQLELLDCCCNNLTELPPLPRSLKELHCTSNKLTSLPVLPLLLRDLRCGNNSLTSLPTLPFSLEVLWCFNNELIEFPALPYSLRDLYCSFNPLRELPNPLPENLVKLTCDNSSLTSLPALPASLEELICYGNELTSLPPLKHIHSLKCLDCRSNKLTFFPNSSTSGVLSDSIIEFCSDIGQVRIFLNERELDFFDCDNQKI